MTEKKAWSTEMSKYDEEKIKEIDEELASGQDAYIGYEHDAVQDVGFLRCLLRNAEKQNKELKVERDAARDWLKDEFKALCKNPQQESHRLCSLVQLELDMDKAREKE